MKTQYIFYCKIFDAVCDLLFLTIIYTCGQSIQNQKANQN